MIDPALNALLIAAIEAMDDANTILNPTDKEALVGTLRNASADIRAYRPGQVRKELDHILSSVSITNGVRTTKGYTQAALDATGS